MPVGLSVTLRDQRAYGFLDRLMSIALPRVRDFRGLKAGAFDGRGNYSMGIREQIIFPEIDYDTVDQVRGLDVTITTRRSPTSRRSRCSRRSECRSRRRPACRTRRPKHARRRRSSEEAARHEELRAKAEAEQAALEQLKQENPEA